MNFNHIKTYGYITALNGKKIGLTMTAEGICKTLLCQEVSQREQNKKDRLEGKIEARGELFVIVSFNFHNV